MLGDFTCDQNVTALGVASVELVLLFSLGGSDAVTSVAHDGKYMLGKCGIFIPKEDALLLIIITPLFFINHHPAKIRSHILASKSLLWPLPISKSPHHMHALHFTVILMRTLHSSASSSSSYCITNEYKAIAPPLGSSSRSILACQELNLGRRRPARDTAARHHELTASSDDFHAMNDERRSPLHQPKDDLSGTPLLYKPDERSTDLPLRGRDTMNDFGDDTPRGRRSRVVSPLMGSRAHTSRHSFQSRRSALRSVSPQLAASSTARKKYTLAGVFLVICLVSFVVQTELSAYIQQDLGWDKAYCMLYLTHGAWTLLWPVQLLILRLQNYSVPWHTFWRRHVALLRSTAIMVQTQDLDWSRPAAGSRPSATRYLARMTAVIATALTIAGFSWYVAVNLTTPSDLTAIYNCSAFFAYVFSVPLLREPLRLDKSIAVIIAIAGVLVVAYGAEGQSLEEGGDGTQGRSGSQRFAGNMIIGAGSILYGLYEVLYKRYACPPNGCSPVRGVIFANTFGALLGLFTLVVLWVPLPFLHWTGIETFYLPTGHTAWMLFFSVIANATFAGSFLVLISLTSPVLSSVASLLTIFIVAVTDWMLTGEPLSAAAMMGGLMIMVAFLMLAWSTWREMTEGQHHKPVDLTDSGDDTDRDLRED
ncbi:hypothetical protein ACRALDRAFT_2017271 [Sodiomyces alcalophilus JCM 7366]|uniref:uncharacterized protein n=1 Tax=Sodiomyces alcalophilus JCM 7366 TaxID=591952 RepID=UPI0039B36549